MIKRKWFQWNSADGFLLLTALLWGINIPVVKLATNYVDPLGFNALRMILSTFTLGICWWIETKIQSNQRKQAFRAISSTASSHATEKITTRTLGEGLTAPHPTASPLWHLAPRILLFAMFSGLLYPLAFMFGIERTTAGNTALLLASMPMWTALLSRFFLAERLNRLTWIGLGVTLLGTLLIISAKGGVDLSPHLLTGNLLMLAGAIIWASATVTSAPLLKQISPLKLAFISASITTPIHIAMSWHSISAPDFQWGNLTLLACIAYSGILSTGIAYATWNIGVRKLGGSHAAVYQNVVTMLAVVISWVVLKEPVLMMQIMGGLVAIAGLFLIRRGRSHR